MKYTNTIAENYVVSAILNDPESITHLKGEGITQSSFHNHLPKLLWNKLTKLHAMDRNHEIEIYELSDDIKGSPNADELKQQISAVRGEYAGKEFLKSHIKTVKEQEALRKGHVVASQALQSLEHGSSPEEVSEALRSGSEAITGILSSQADWKNAEQSVEEFTEMLQRIHQEKSEAGIPTSVHWIDHYTGGMRANELWVVAAPTSGGKTVLMLQFLASVLKLGKRAVMFSLETDADRIHGRLACSTQNIPMGRLMGNAGEVMCKADFLKIKDYVNDSKKADSLIICDSDSITLDDIEAKLARISEIGTFDCVIIDYIQLVELADGKDLPRHEQIAKVTRRLKQLAKRYQVPIITASQLNDDGRLRESRAIGMDADVVLMIDPEAGDIGLAKNRNGERGVKLPLVMNGVYQRFE
jgi:replicative DNA helicase